MTTITRLVTRFAVVLSLACWRPAYGQDATAPAILRKVGFDQRLNHQVPGDLTFTDENGAKVRLGDYFGDKPIILVLAYYRCPMLCTLVLNGLVQGMRDMPFSIGKEFRVLTISFDPRETPDLAAAKKQTYLASYGRAGAGADWHFLTGKQDSIAKLTEAIGFRYVYDEKQDQFIHTSGIVILTPHGKVSRYFYGIRFPARDLRLGLVEASANQIGSPTDQVLLYCFHYDPQTGKYTTSILNFVRLGGVATVLAVAALVWFLLRRERRHRNAAAAEQRSLDMAGLSNDSRRAGP
ncbi:MAG: SCO family protein [Planctomycetaceae bacterium]|nr:SCO family protein [Planctomycetaceae bacterium]